MATMNYTDLQNLVVLARKSLPFISEKLSAAEGAAAYNAIGNAEVFLAAALEAQKQQAANSQHDQNVHVVEINQQNAT